MCLYCTMTLTVLPSADPCLAFARKPDSSEPMFESLPFWRAEGDVDPNAIPVARSTTSPTRFPHAALCRSWRQGFCCFHVRNIDLPCRSGGKSPARNHLFRCTRAANGSVLSHCKQGNRSRRRRPDGPLCPKQARTGQFVALGSGSRGPSLGVREA